MNNYLISHGISFPQFWDKDKVIQAFTTLDTYELYSFFGCSNSTSFTRLMKPCFPNRPEKTSYSKYVRDIVCAFVSASVPKPKWDIHASQAAQRQREEDAKY